MDEIPFVLVISKKGLVSLDKKILTSKIGSNFSILRIYLFWEPFILVWNRFWWLYLLPGHLLKQSPDRSKNKLKTGLTETEVFSNCSDQSIFQEMLKLFHLPKFKLSMQLLWYCEKKLFVIEKNFWNSRLKAENVQNFWDH